MNGQDFSTEPQVGMHISELNMGALNVFSASPLRMADISNGLKNEGQKVTSEKNLTNDFCGKSAFIQPAAREMAVAAPAPAPSIAPGLTA